MATIIDKHTENVVGKPYRGKLDVRFDEGVEGIYSRYGGWPPGQPKQQINVGKHWPYKL